MGEWNCLLCFRNFSLDIAEFKYKKHMAPESPGKKEKKQPTLQFTKNNKLTFVY